MKKNMTVMPDPPTEDLSLKQRTKQFAHRLALLSYRLTELRITAYLASRLGRAQMLTEQQMAIVDAIRRQQGKCRLLVFGVGYDSAFWNAINWRGRTLFVEDNQQWAETVASWHTQLNVKNVSYTCLLSNLRDEVEDRVELATWVKDNFEREEFDVAIVDGPTGMDESCPGRLQSVYAAKMLVVDGGDIFVHDCIREGEKYITECVFEGEKPQVEVGSLWGFKVRNRR